MTDKAIGGLTAATSAGASDLFLLETSGGNSRKITADNARTSLGWKLISSVTASGTAVVFTGLGGYSELLLIAVDVTTGSSAFRFVQASTDNGATYYTTSGDYKQMAASGTTVSSGDMSGQSAGQTTASIMAQISGNLAGSIKLARAVNYSTGFLANSGMITNAINAMKLGCTVTMTGGTVTLYGR